jgi:hypothetical protein
MGSHRDEHYLHCGTGHKLTPSAEEWERHRKQDAQIWVRFSLHSVEPNVLTLYAGEPPKEGVVRST